VAAVIGGCDEATLIRAMVVFRNTTGYQIAAIRLTKEQREDWIVRYGHSPCTSLGLSMIREVVEVITE